MHTAQLFLFKMYQDTGSGPAFVFPEHADLAPFPEIVLGHGVSWFLHPGPREETFQEEEIWFTLDWLAVLCANRVGFPAGPAALSELSAQKDCSGTGFVGYL